MEQKKILWILLSVTLFLFIISITGVVWFYPGRITTAENDDGNSSRDPEQAAMDFDPVEWVRQGEDFPGLIDAPLEEEGFSIVYGETEDGEAVVNLLVDDKQNVVQEQSVIEETVTEPAQEVKTVTVIETIVSAPAPKKINVLEFWIQAGSFSSRTRAESSSQILSKKGFSNLVTIKTVNKEDYFRVRMGPYSSKLEAEKFLGWVKGIDAYENSYISEVYVQKTMN
jgi:SPOR domain